MNFSRRTEWDVRESEFAADARAARTGQGKRLLDLTVANPTACGFEYDEGTLLQALSEPAAVLYEPEPFGMTSAREAVAAYYSDAGVAVSAGNICLTTSTSEAYSFLFRLLCDPGDEVLVATPSYPLFDFIAGLDGVRLVEYPLLYHDGWFIDFHALRAAISDRTRAIIVVHPNNPTGHFCSAQERLMLRQICAEYDFALIVDEVFLDYPLRRDASGISFLREPVSALTFVLSGISKVCGLPQMKCSWIVAAGSVPVLTTALARLEVIADTFLSMNAPIQHLLPGWLSGRHSIQGQITARTTRNLVALDAALSGSTCERLAADAGWCCVLRVPRTANGMPFEQALLRRGVLVQPGDFYGMPAGRVVLSLLTPPADWDAGLGILRQLALD